MPEAHRASVLTRDLLVLGKSVSFHLRRRMRTSETDFEAMQHLMRRGELTHTQLAQELHLSTAATTTVVDRLVRRGHAERVPDPADRRKSLIRPLSHAARALMDELRPMISQSDAVVKAMPAEGQEAVVEYLESVMAAMRTLVARYEDEEGDDGAAPTAEAPPAVTESDGPHAAQPPGGQR